MTSGSYRTILRSSSIVGGASVINIITGLVKMKAAAVFLGPAGVGLIGLYQNLIQTGSTVAGLGIQTAGTRHVASVSEQNAPSIDLARRALICGAVVQALLGGLAFWLLGSAIAEHLVADLSRIDEVPWLALGVALMVLAAAQTAVLTGLRQIKSIAKITIGNGVLGAVGGILAIWWFGQDALVPFVLITPLATFLIGHFYIRKIKQSGPRQVLRSLIKEWSSVVRVGAPLMVGALITLSGGLAVRVLLQRELGAEALGHFQASWAIGMTYLTFVLGAMGTDFFPRLSAVIEDRKHAADVVNQQTEVALLLCGPILVAMLGCAPLVIRLLYSSEFGPAVDVLRWQIAGDIFKVISWPLGFVLLAQGASYTFIAAEAVGMSVFVLVVALAMPSLGVAAAGVGFFTMYVVYLPLVWWFGGRLIGFYWSRAVVLHSLSVFAAALVVVAAVMFSDLLGVITGIALGVILGVWALARISSVTEATGRLAFLAGFEHKILTWIKQKSDD